VKIILHIYTGERSSAVI